MERNKSIGIDTTINIGKNDDIGAGTESTKAAGNNSSAACAGNSRDAASPEPRRRITRLAPTNRKTGKIKAAAYCRVSTSHDGQLTSLESQRAHYEELIGSHPDWELAGIYYEEGVTGTKKEIRPELNRMLGDCRAGKINLILTKSISRFARNTSDCLEMVRSLTGLGVNIIFEKEHIDTRRMEGELLLSILSSLAEEESHSIAGNEHWAIQKRFQSGTFRYSKAPYGYKLSDGNFVIDEEEAATVRWIFSQVLSGVGTSTIAKQLNANHIPTKREREGGNPGKWCSQTVSNILSNVDYTGDVLMQKTYRDEHFKRVTNFGERPQYYMDGHHPPIVDHETFERARAAVRQRGKESGNDPPSGPGRHGGPHRNRYPFTGVLSCGCCGSVMVRQTQRTTSGCRYHWGCKTHLGDITACGMKMVPEENVKNAFITMMNKLSYAKEILIDPYVEAVEEQELNRHRERLRQIHQALEQNMENRHRLTQLLSKGCVEPVLHLHKMVALEEEASMLRNEQEALKSGLTQTAPAQEFRQFVMDWGCREGHIFPGEEFNMYINKVEIHSRTSFTFFLKCGLRFTEDISAVISIENRPSPLPKAVPDEHSENEN